MDIKPKYIEKQGILGFLLGICIKLLLLYNNILIQGDSLSRKKGIPK